MATKKILIQVILDDKASREQKKVQSALNQTTSAIKKMTAEEEKQFIAQEKLNLQNKLYINELKQKAQAELFAADATARTRAQAGLNNAILLETGRLASDVNFGFTAIANNLSQVVTLFSSFVRTSDGVKGAFRELGKSIMGTGGLLIAVQLIIGLLPRLDKKLRELRSASRDLSEIFEKVGEEVSDVSANFEIYIDTLQDSTKSEKQKKIAIENLNEEFPDFVQNLKDSGVSMDDVKNSTEAATEQIDKQREAIIRLARSRAAQSEIEKLESEIITKKVQRQLELNELGLTETELIQAKYQADKTSIDEFSTVQDAQRIRDINRLAGQTEDYNNYIEERKKQVDLLMDYIEMEDNGKGKSGDNDKKYTKLKVDNLTKEISAIKKVGKVQNDFAEKRAKLNADVVESEKQSFDERRTILESEEIQGQASIDLQEQQALKELEQIEISENLKGQARANIELYYDDLRKKNAEETKEAMIKIDEEERDARLENLKLIGSGLMAASEIAGRTTGAGKALAVAGTLLSTYAAAQKAYESQLIPADPTSVARAILAASVATLQGLARVKSILAVKTPAMKEQSVTGTAGGADINVAAPDFNVVGQGGVNQLGQVIGARFGQPIRAYVVSGDISSAQELDRSITAGARLD